MEIFIATICIPLFLANTGIANRPVIRGSMSLKISTLVFQISWVLRALHCGLYRSALLMLAS